MLDHESNANRVQRDRNSDLDGRAVRVRRRRPHRLAGDAV